MKDTINIIKKVAALTDKAILFHSLTGKDSTVLLDLMYPYFKEIICVFMFVVPDLEYNNRRKAFIKIKYPKVSKIIDTPHYSLASMVKFGYMGIRKDEKVKRWDLHKIDGYIRDSNPGFEWLFYGFKQSDSMNRRLMLRTYDEQAINYNNQKCYPLTKWKNKDCIAYIDSHQLPKPMNFNTQQTSGDEISNIDYLLWVRKNSPSDLEKIFSLFPIAKTKLYEYDYHQKEN